MLKLHAAKDFPIFQTYVKQLIEDLFPGFRLHKTEHKFSSTGLRADFTLINNANHRDRMVADAKFYGGPIRRSDVIKVKKYKGYPFFAGHAALIFPANSQVQAAAVNLARASKVMLIQLPVTKLVRYEITRTWLFFTSKKAVGFEIGGNLSPQEAARGAKWFVGPQFAPQVQPPSTVPAGDVKNAIVLAEQIEPEESDVLNQPD